MRGGHWRDGLSVRGMGKGEGEEEDVGERNRKSERWIAVLGRDGGE